MAAMAWLDGDRLVRVNSNTYGSVIAPTNMGSGGRHSERQSGRRGDSADGGGNHDGGFRRQHYRQRRKRALIAIGSGGSIYLTTGWLTGGGTIRANGGQQLEWRAVGGGGGRVAIILTGAGADFTSWTGTNTAYGGSGAEQCGGGGDGLSARRQRVPAGAGTVIVNNGTTATNPTFTTLPAFSNSTEKISTDRLGDDEQRPGSGWSRIRTSRA